MAEETTEKKIARLQRLRQSGLREMTFDGLSLTLDPEALDDVLVALQEEEDGTATKPRASSIDLSGW